MQQLAQTIVHPLTVTVSHLSPIAGANDKLGSTGPLLVRVSIVTALAERDSPGRSLSPPVDWHDWTPAPPLPVVPAATARLRQIIGSPATLVPTTHTNAGTLIRASTTAAPRIPVAAALDSKLTVYHYSNFILGATVSRGECDALGTLPTLTRSH